MHPPLPREIHSFFGQSGAHHRQRVHSVRSMFRGLPAERQRNFQRNRKSESAFVFGRKSDRFACAVVYRKLRRRGDRRLAYRAQKTRLLRGGGNGDRRNHRENGIRKHSRGKNARRGDFFLLSLDQSFNTEVFSERIALPCERAFAYAGARERHQTQKPGRKSGVYRALRRQKRRGGVLRGHCGRGANLRRSREVAARRKYRNRRRAGRNGGEPRALFPHHGRHFKNDEKRSRVHLSFSGRRGKLHGGSSRYRKRQSA